VASADDPRIAAYRHIRKKDPVGRQGHFIATFAITFFEK
jgi:hypothetical protein